MQLYGDRQSGNCYKIQLLSTMLDLPLDWVDVDILAGQTQTPEFLSLNPNGKIPLLVLDDGRVLAESNAILNFLAADTPFLPEDPYQLALVQQWQFFEQYSHEPFIAVARFIQRYLGLPDERRVEYNHKRQGGYRALKVMEQQLQQSAFIAGSRLTTADIALYAYTHVAHEGGFDVSGFPHITAWMSRIQEVPGYTAMEA